MSTVIPFPRHPNARELLDRVVAQMDERDRETERLRALLREVELRAMATRGPKGVELARYGQRLRKAIERREMGGA